MILFLGGAMACNFGAADVGAAPSVNKSDYVQSEKQQAATMLGWLGTEWCGNARVGRSWGNPPLLVFTFRATIKHAPLP